MKRFLLMCFLAAIIVIVPGCNRQFIRKKLYISAKIFETPVSQQMLNMQPQVTVWVHGTKFFSRPFFKKFLYVPQGLVRALDIDPTYHHYSIAQTLSTYDPEKFPLEHFYFFGWSGFLSFEAREKAAKDLCYELQKLVEYYRTSYRQNPCIRIITHSHGGNVALNMAVHNNDINLVIDELILLACPVQIKTASYIYNPMFKKIYSLFSTLDSVQILDPQGLYSCLTGQVQKPLFSERLFPCASHVIQAKLKINGHGVMHVGFLFTSFLQLLPHILKKLDKWYANQLYETPKQPLLLSVEKRSYRLQK